jgi:predicted RNA methylase
MTHSSPSPSRYDRQSLLFGPKRNAILDLAEVIRYGTDNYGDPDYISIYGLPPPEWFQRGVRLLGRTLIECTRDPLADAIGREIAAAIAVSIPADAQVAVIDPFAGSGNTLFWIQRNLPHASGLGVERDPLVFEVTRRNLSLLNLPLEVRQADSLEALERLSFPRDTVVVAFIAPPWGTALGRDGLDLRETSPPVTEIVDRFIHRFAANPMAFAIQTYEQMIQPSIDALVPRFDWWRARNFHFSPPGLNSGLLLGTCRMRTQTGPDATHFGSA